MKYADLPKVRLSHLVKPDGLTLEDWQVMLRMQQASREAFEVSIVSERYNPGEYMVFSPSSGNRYKVVYRGPKSPWNYCDCMDFKTSQLGTCKHVEAARQWIADHHKRIHRDLPAYTSVYLSYRGNDRRVKIRIGSSASEAFRKLIRKYFSDFDELKPDAFEAFDTFLREAQTLDPTFKYYSDAEEYVLAQRETIRRRKVIAAKYDDVALDSLLKIPLYAYQKEGARFAAKTGRAILADEMGLGKTVQSIAAAEMLRREQFVEQVLVLCPTTLKYQWKREIERFTGEKVVLVDGTPEQRRELLQAAVPYKVVSYNSIKEDLKELKSVDTDMVIMDEVQRLKNWNTQIARAVRRIHSNYVLALTGTPLENRLEELYSIVELVDQFLLSPYYLFRDRYLMLDETGRTVGYKNLQEVHKRLRPVMIRRRKADVAFQLPERIDKNLLVPMTAEQLELHNKLKLQAARLVAKWHRMHYLSEMDRRQLLLTLSQMRMACDSLFVVDETTRADTKVEEVMNILDECDETTKVVIFSQWERMIRLVGQELERMDIPYESLHGDIPAKERDQRVDRFCKDARVRVFLSTDTGGVGLNLQAAHVVINLDVPWNPAVLEQRVGRVHRIGQQRGVEVINLISAGTIEEDMLSKLDFKASLFEGALDGGVDTVYLEGNKFDTLLGGLSGYLNAEDFSTAEAIAQSDEEEVIRKEPLQTELHFEEAPQQKEEKKEEPVEEKTPPTQPLEANFLRSFSELMTADEQTRARVAAVLKQVAEGMVK